jgi:hypothetical protein
LYPIDVSDALMLNAAKKLCNEFSYRGFFASLEKVPDSIAYIRLVISYSEEKDILYNKNLLNEKEELILNLSRNITFIEDCIKYQFLSDVFRILAEKQKNRKQS